MKRGNLLALVLSLVFLYLFLFDPAPGSWLSDESSFGEALFRSKIDWREVWNLLTGIALAPFCGALAALVLSLVVRAWRWRKVVSHLDLPSLGLMFNLTNLGYMANNLLPMRLGEVLRGGALASRSRLSFSGALATVVLERLLDVIGSLSCLFLLLLIQWGDGSANAAMTGRLEPFSGLALLLAAAAGLGLALLLGLVIWRESFLGLARRLARRLPGGLEDRVMGVLDSFTAGLATLRSPARVAVLLLQTALLFMCYLASLWFMLDAFGLRADSLAALGADPLGSLLLILVFVTLGYMIPAAPGAIGTVQYFTAEALELLGAETSSAVGFALGNHLLTYVVLTLLGLLALIRLRLSFGDLAGLRQNSVQGTLDEGT